MFNVCTAYVLLLLLYFHYDKVIYKFQILRKLSVRGTFTCTLIIGVMVKSSVPLYDAFQ